MRNSFLAILLVGALSLGACSGGKDSFELGDRTGVSEGPIVGQTSTGVVEPYEAADTGYDYSNDIVTSNTVGGTMEDLIVNVGDRVYFGYDRIDLTPEALNQLQMQARWMQQYSNVRVVIEGHADERGTREYKLALGDRRANSVKNYLVSLGISPNRVSTISYGKEMPEVLGSSAQSWARNRRAVTKVQ